MYTVIGNVRSRALRVLWMLEELGVEYDHIPALPRSAEIFEVNPLGKVPALLVDDQVLTDSVAILTYLADKHDMLTFPAGTIERARQDALTHLVLDQFDALLWTAARHSFVLPKERRLPEIKDSLRWEFEQGEQLLAGALGDGPYLMGQTMTIADILLAHCLNWAVLAKFPVTEASLVDFAARMSARPAFQRAVSREQA